MPVRPGLSHMDMDMDMDQNAALTASPREGDTAIIKTELVRSMSVADDVRDGTHLRTAC